MYKLYVAKSVSAMRASLLEDATCYRECVYWRVTIILLQSKTKATMANLESRKHISPDSGFPITLYLNFSPKIKDWVPTEPPRKEFDPGKDRASYADPEKKALLSAARRVDLTESIGTMLEGIQLSQLTAQQLDELALLVNERSVVFFRDQDLTTEQQVSLFEHYGTLDRHPAQKDARHVVIRGSREDHHELLKYTPWPSGDFHADTSCEANPPFILDAPHGGAPTRRGRHRLDLCIRPVRRPVPRHAPICRWPACRPYLPPAVRHHSRPLGHGA